MFPAISDRGIAQQFPLPRLCSQWKQIFTQRPNTSNPIQSHPTLTTLKQIDLSHESSSSDDQLDEQDIGKDINGPNRDSLNSYRTA